MRGEPAEGIDRKDAPRRLHATKAQPATLLRRPRHGCRSIFDSIACPAIDPRSVLEPDRGRRAYRRSELLPAGISRRLGFLVLHQRPRIKPGISIRLWFWLDRPVSDDELKSGWRQPIADGLIDTAIFNPIQAIYTAAPIFVGMPDPVPFRCGIWRGDSDAVDVPLIERPQRSAAPAPRGRAGQRRRVRGAPCAIGDDAGQRRFSTAR